MLFGYIKLAFLYLLVCNYEIQTYKIHISQLQQRMDIKSKNYEKIFSSNTLYPKYSIKTSELYGFSDYDDSKSSGLSFKVLGVLILGIFGLFGTDIIGSLSGVKNSLTEQSKPAVSELKNVSKDGSNRGALTRLTRKEINYKLAQVPIFYISSDNGQSIFIKDNIGKLFSDKNSAIEYMKSINDNNDNLKVDATTLDAVYYPLIVRQQKIGNFIEGVSGKLDINAAYELNGSLDQVAYASSQWQSVHPHDFPLFRMPGLAFNKPEGLEIPLFLRKEDALSSYERLVDSQAEAALDLLKANNKNVDKSIIPEVQITSLQDMVSLFSSGGFEGRAIEFYPSIESINNAKELF